MKKFDILPDESGTTVRVIASTKVGLVTAALEGLFAVARPKFVETDAEKRQFADTSARPFSVQAADFKDLVVKLLETAWKEANDRKEAYTGLRFSLITDVKTEGELLGLPITGFDRKIKSAACDSPAVQKNQVGNWEASFSFKV